MNHRARTFIFLTIGIAFHIFATNKDEKRAFMQEQAHFHGELINLRPDRLRALSKTDSLGNYFMHSWNKLRLRPGKTIRYVDYPDLTSGSPLICFCDTTFNLLQEAARTARKDSTHRYWAAIRIQKNLRTHLPSLLNGADSICVQTQPDDTLIVDHERYNQFIREFIHDYFSNSANHPSLSVAPEDSETGYWQYLMFYYLSDMFHLAINLHSTNATPIVSKEDLAEHLSQISPDALSQKERRKLLRAKPVNRIEMQTEYCHITILSYTQFGIIYQDSYRIERKPPYTITFVGSKEIAHLKTGTFY